MRIVSLLPAATEIVCALGLADELVGISHLCDHPPGLAGRPVVTRPAGGHLGAPAFPAWDPPVALDAALLAGLHADLVLTGAPGVLAGVGGADGGVMPASGHAGEDPVAVAAGPQASVVRLEPASLEGIFHAIATVGAMADSEDEAVGLVEILRERLADVEETVAERRDEDVRSPRVVSLEWLDPPVSPGLWVPEQVGRAGGWDVLGNAREPGVETSWQVVRDVDPEMILLMPRGMHLADAVRAWRAAPRPAWWGEVHAVRRGQVFVLDAASYFTRPGPRVIDGIEILAELFDPAAFVDLAPADGWVPVP